MTAKGIKEAWRIADDIFPTDYMKDERSSAVAGYDVYRSTAADGWYNYICDLGDRLEINLADGRTINVWIEPEKEEDMVVWVKKINSVAQVNFDMAQGMLDMMNEICKTKFGWLCKRVVIFDNPDGTVAERYAHVHDAYACLK